MEVEFKLASSFRRCRDNCKHCSPMFATGCGEGGEVVFSPSVGGFHARGRANKFANFMHLQFVEYTPLVVLMLYPDIFHTRFNQTFP